MQSVEGLINQRVEDMWPGIITFKTQRRTAIALKMQKFAVCERSKFTIIRCFGQSLSVDHSVLPAAIGMIIPGWAAILLMAHIPPWVISGNMVPLAGSGDLRMARI